MKDKMMKWINASKDIVNNSQSCICPNCQHSGLSFQFVGDKSKGLGHVFIWCNFCLHGIHVSRTKIPKGVNVLPLNISAEELLKHVPRYRIVG